VLEFLINKRKNLKVGINMDLKKKVKELPSSPGVYLMKDSQGDIIYVGKSKNLKKRVQSYFQNSKNHSPKVEKLVKNLKNFDYIVTDTEFEAFILECNYIKEIKPIYNKLMKSPLSYTYIKIELNELYSSIDISNTDEIKNNTLYFGPYTNKNTVETAIHGIKKFTKISCSNPSKKNSTCLNYSLGLCIGICQGSSVADEYRNILNRIVALLDNTNKTLLDEMNEKMTTASEDFDFETAAEYRDYINAISYLMDKEKVKEFAEENQNIIMVENLDENTMKLFLIKGNKIIFSDKYKFHNSTNNDTISLIESNILSYFNSEILGSSLDVNRHQIDEAQIIYSYLKNNNCKYTIIPDSWLLSENKTTIDEEIKKLLYDQ